MKKTNKGFSLVELIIVIAIMAILAGAIAPALIRYIDKSRKSNDVTAAKNIKTAVEAAMGNEEIYGLMTAATPGTGGYASVVIVHPGEKTPSSSEVTGYAKCVTVDCSFTYTDPDLNDSDNQARILAAAQREIASSIGEKMPKCKYKKNAAHPKSDDNKPVCFVAAISAGGSVEVFITAQDEDSLDGDYEPVIGNDDTDGTTDDPTDYKLVPEVSNYYQ